MAQFSRQNLSWLVRAVKIVFIIFFEIRELKAGRPEETERDDPCPDDMPLTAEEVRVGEAVGNLLQNVMEGEVVKLLDLAMFIVQTHGISHTDPAAFAQAMSETINILLNSLWHLPRTDEYSDAGVSTPTVATSLTLPGIIQLLQMGNHLIAVEVRNYNGEMFRRALDKALGK